MKSVATRRFWDQYHALPGEIQALAAKNYRLWRTSPNHPSLHFRRLKGSGDRFTVRIGDRYRALGRLTSGTMTWVWNGSELRGTLGNAIAAPVLPFSPNNASATLPGTIGLTVPLFAAINEQVAEQLIKTGFKNVVLMGDHGGGQAQLGEVAKKLDEKYSSQGIHVVYCDEVYSKANGDFDQYLAEKGLPVSSHAGIPDTSEMLYLGGDKGWVRKELVATAVGSPAGRGGQKRDPDAPRAVSNGITGDARPSTPELGKRLFDMKVDYAVNQIHRLLDANKTSAAQ